MIENLPIIKKLVVYGFVGCGVGVVLSSVSVIGVAGVYGNSYGKGQ
jgi:hypothetical protein